MYFNLSYRTSISKKPVDIGGELSVEWADPPTLYWFRLDRQFHASYEVEPF
ncbi:hypothetical protein MGG_17511 [Pyricularia oryzae 70-15]|uniref:Uncharacterized protein n=1 Tax=Pyricularia oryzae (strain 70-15 / ATCC MYA-4617 / FGSC 8958) TaxID=242507 RepID=G4NDW2_PYRO7|nr:uncharacterized protein MGG_17511 [Pyricularia oryzae 70-15]EHA49344.1 hypothetical protein MGG_17511 [Pyricularia oryzae 70-15]